MVAPTNEELGSGIANSNTWLRGDRTWSEINCPLSQYMSYGSIGLRGENNTVAPNTMMDMSADVVWLKEYPAEETIITKKNTGTLTNDINVNGINGRDNPAAFSANSWIHFYFIASASAIATLSSANGPGSGPVLPVGYTHYCYVFSVYLAGSALRKVYVRGREVFYRGWQNVLSGGSSESATQVNLSAYVPLEAEKVYGNARFKGQNTVFDVNQYVYGHIQLTTSDLWLIMATTVSTDGSNNWGSSFFAIPNINQALYYKLQKGTVNIYGIQMNIDILGYTVKNGG